MIKLQGSGFFDARHERNDEIPVIIGEEVGHCPVYNLACEISLKDIQGLVEIHHQQVNAVNGPFLTCSDPLYDFIFDYIALFGRDLCNKGF